MKVLFQKPRWATATFKVSAVAVSAAAIAIKPISKTNVLLMSFSHKFVDATELRARLTPFNPP